MAGVSELNVDRRRRAIIKTFVENVGWRQRFWSNFSRAERDWLQEHGVGNRRDPPDCVTIEVLTLGLNGTILD